MSSKLIQRINGFSSYRIDASHLNIKNLKCEITVDLDDFFGIAYTLDSFNFDYRIDKKFNIIILGKK